MKIGIIGAGPAGMTAALRAAWQGMRVTLVERNAMVGRKLLVTGSGRCNITNDGVAANRYACADAAWMETVLSHFGTQELLAMLREIGILTMKTADGWYYPLSESAQSVADAFFVALKSAGVTVEMNAHVTRIEKWPDHFMVEIRGEQSSQRQKFDRLVIAAGGMAYPKLGSTGDLFPALEVLGHTVQPIRPALAPVLLDLGELKCLSGVRFDAGVRLMEGDQLLAESAGNLIITDWGMNGPAVMDISHAIQTDQPGRYTLSVSFLHFHKVEFAGFLAENRDSRLPIRNFLGAFFAPKVSSFFLKQAQILESTALEDVKDHHMSLLLRLLTDYRLPVKGVRGFDFCQVSVGGVPVKEVDPLTMESHLVKGLYLVGETLDVVGPCGGFNLHHAFATGALAGKAVAEAVTVRD